MEHYKFYGMSFNPFDKGVLVKNCFLTADMKEMEGRLSHLKDNPGIAVFTADSGFGKTFSLRCFKERLNQNITKFSYICLSTITTLEFYKQICMTLHLPIGTRKVSMFQEIQAFFETAFCDKRIHHILCLDEAQYLNGEILKDLLMLTNFVMDSKSCFSIVLLGQPLLNNLLMRQTLEALRQRITINYRFLGLSEEEAMHYIRDRMILVGAAPSIFDENAMLSAYHSCGGSIRKLNHILTKALMIGGHHQKQTIDIDIILTAVNEISLI